MPLGIEFEISVRVNLGFIQQIINANTQTLAWLKNAICHPYLMTLFYSNICRLSHDLRTRFKMRAKVLFHPLIKSFAYFNVVKLMERFNPGEC